MTQVTTSHRSGRPNPGRSRWIEAGAVLGSILLVPTIFTALGRFTFTAADLLGFNALAGNLAGNAGTTDVGWEVAASRGLLDPGVSAYAPLNTIAALIQMTSDNGQANSHPHGTATGHSARLPSLLLVAAMLDDRDALRDGDHPADHGSPDLGRLPDRARPRTHQ